MMAFSLSWNCWILRGTKTMSLILSPCTSIHAGFSWPTFCFLLCHLLIPSPVFFQTYTFLWTILFPLGIEMLFCAPSQGAWWLLAVAVCGVAARNAAVATWFLQACCWGLWLTVMWTLEWGLACAIAGTSLAICAAPAPMPHPSWDPALPWSLSPGSFLMLTAVFICLVQLLGLT